MRDPPSDGGSAARRRALGLILLLAVAGCTGPQAVEAELASASLEGTIRVGDAFRLLDARLTVAPADAAPEGTRASPVPLADPPSLARTALARDHWVLEARIEERGPGAGLGAHSARLEWNGEEVGVVFLEGVKASGTLGALLRYDVGPSIAPSNVYSFELRKTA